MKSKRHPYFELFYRNTGGFLPGTLVLLRPPGFCVLEGPLNEHENREDVFFNQSHYMNSTFRYSTPHMRPQMPVVYYILVFNEGGLHCKTGYILLCSFGSGVLKCIPVNMPLPF